MKRYMKGNWPTTAPTTYIVWRRTSSLPWNPRSSLRPATYALSFLVSQQAVTGMERRTDIGLIDVFHPVGKKNIGHNEKIELRNELPFLRSVVVLKPADLIPFATLVWFRHYGESSQRSLLLYALHIPCNLMYVCWGLNGPGAGVVQCKLCRLRASRQA